MEVSEGGSGIFYASLLVCAWGGSEWRPWGNLGHGGGTMSLSRPRNALVSTVVITGGGVLVPSTMPFRVCQRYNMLKDESRGRLMRPHGTIDDAFKAT